jgi:hypothetical protein
MNVFTAHPTLTAVGRHLWRSFVLPPEPEGAYEGTNCSVVIFQMALRVNMASGTYVSKL